MIKSLAVFLATIFFLFAQNYDPNTGELIHSDEYDPLTGELKKENKAQIKKRIELTTGEVILGYLINNNNDRVIIYSSTVDTIKIEKENISTIVDYIDPSKINKHLPMVQKRIKKSENTQTPRLPTMKELKQIGEGLVTLGLIMISFILGL